MLSPADRILAEREASLPGLAVLLDPEAMRDVLHDAGADGVEAVTPRYVRYKPATNAIVAYDVLVNGHVEILHAKTVRAERGAPGLAKLHAASARARVSPSLGFARHLVPELSLVVSAWPNDHRVRALVTTATDAGRRTLLRRTVPGRTDLRDATLVPLAYKPERRFVAALRCDDRPVAVLRLYARGVRMPMPGAAPPGIVVPETLGTRPTHGVAVTTWVDGTPLDGVLAAGAAGALAQDVGRAIARWHAVDDPRLPERRFPDERAAFEAAPLLLDALLPDVGPAARELAARLAVLLRVPVRAATLHGDLHAAQVVVGPSGIGLIDLDEACRGEAGSDLGAFIASVLADVASGRLSAHHARDFCDGVVEGYARQAGDVPAALDAWVAAHLLRRAPQPFRTRQAGWPQEATHLVALARETADARRWRERVPTTSARPVADAAMPGLSLATTPRLAERAMASRLGLGWRYVRVCDARVVRHKPGRRALVEYDLAGLAPRPDTVVTVIGKVRARGADQATATLMAQLWEDEFAPDSLHGASVPQPLGVVPELSMWLQARVSGVAATTWAFDAEAAPRLRMAAASLRRLHASGIPVARTHGVAEELAILQPRLTRLAQARPALAGRVARVRDGIVERLIALPPATASLLHRDLHPDHLIWNGSRLYLIDFDLAARGDAGLDVGNMAAHLLELGLRVGGSALRLQAATDAFVDGYLSVSPDVTAAAVRTWTTAALARLAALSVELPGREHTTDTLLAMCDARLAEDASGLRETRS